MTKYILQGMKRDKVLEISGISKHQYYYKSKGTKSGRKPSLTTKKYDCGHVPNEEVIATISKKRENPDSDYGYIKMTYYLQSDGFIINKKKVYRLMKTHHLLKERHKKSPKTYAQYRKVLPLRPLELLEMDIKLVWVEEFKKHAYILTVIDTFTRKALFFTVAYSITKHDVKRAWEHIILQHLQPNNCLDREINIEVRNDNDKRFSAKIVQDFFKENKLNQVFTHPYTPQENGHIESFHAILSKHLKPYNFWTLDELNQNLVLFYEFYNNERIHGSIAYTAPNDFEILWNLNLVEMTVNEKKRRIKFKLKTPRHQVKQHTGNNELEGSSLLDFAPLDAVQNRNLDEMVSAETSHNLRCKKSPSVALCDTKLADNSYI